MSADARIHVGVLGPVVALNKGGDSLVEPAGPLGKAFLVALALAGPTGVSSARLVDDVWGDTPPRQAKAALQTLVSRVRQSSASDLVRSTATGYAFGPAAPIDLAVAAALLGEVSREGDPSRILGASSTALALWRGDPGADLPDGDLSTELGERARGVYIGLVRARAAARLMTGDAVGALDDATALTDAGAGGDVVVALRMRALTATGDRTGALRLFASHREALADELGSEPGRDLLALNAELLRGTGDDARPTAEAEARGSRPAETRGLRTAPNELLGRDGDVSAIESLIGESRLVTILGPGGLGKTRLAQEVARRAAAATPRVVFVELAGVRSADDAVLALASTLGIREAPATSTVSRLRLGDPSAPVDIRDRIVGTLSERATLLVIDNCEHLIDAAADLVADVLASTTEVRVVATSRSPLAIGAERVYPLGPLESASAGPAVRLFEQRARAARPGAVLPRDVVVRLCERLDGLPLAIELAAARVRSMSVDEIERRLGNRFALLTTGDRSAPERHRTLTAVIDWSWNLLGDDERRLLRRLSRFPDGFSAEAASIVGGDGADDPLASGDVTEALDALVNQSLVSVTDDPATGAVRYRMLETVREFGDLRLVESGESESVRAAMFAWAEWFSNDTRRHLDGDEQIARFAAMAAEQDDLVFVLREAIAERCFSTVAQSFGVLAYYWMMSGSNADVAAFAPGAVDVLRRGDPAPVDRDAAILSFSIAGSLFAFGDFRTGALAIGRLRHLRREGPASDRRLNTLSGLFVGTLGDRGEFTRLLDVAAASDDTVEAELGSMLKGQVSENAGDIEQAFRLSLRANASTVANGHAWGAATSAGILAQLYAQSAQPALALDWAERSRDRLIALGATRDLREIEWRQAAARVSLGQTELAREAVARLLDDTRAGDSDQEDVRLMGAAGLAEIAFLDGDPAGAVRRYDDAIDALRHGKGLPGDPRSPFILLAQAAAVAARVRADSDPEKTRIQATRLRTRLIAIGRAGNSFEDVPIAGAAVFALASWLLWPTSGVAERVPAGEVTRTGLRLAFLSTRMSGRQDLPSLEHARLFDILEARFGSAAVDAACAGTASLSPAAARAQAVGLLADRRLR